MMETFLMEMGAANHVWLKQAGPALEETPLRRTHAEIFVEMVK
jgi:hypothetical protein